MDVVSAVFATYLDVVSNSVHERMTDRMNIEVQAKIVSYQDYQISYSYQLWRIQEKSVCETYSQDLNQKSFCSQAAKSMFRDMCYYLQNNPQTGSKFKKTKNMYCNAATNFKPLISTVSLDDKSDSQKSKQACSVAILKAMDAPTSENIEARKKVCTENE